MREYYCNRGEEQEQKTDFFLLFFFVANIINLQFSQSTNLNALTEIYIYYKFLQVFNK